MFTVLWHIKNIIKLLNLSKEMWCRKLNSAFSWKGVPSERSGWCVRHQFWNWLFFPRGSILVSFLLISPPNCQSERITGHITWIPTSSYINSPWFLFFQMPFRYMEVIFFLSYFQHFLTKQHLTFPTQEGFFLNGFQNTERCRVLFAF